MTAEAQEHDDQDALISTLKQCAMEPRNLAYPQTWLVDARLSNAETNIS